MGYLTDILYNNRVRRVNKTITYAAAGTDQITVVGPTTHVVIDFRGTNTTGLTLEPSGGMPLVVRRLTAATNRRGMIWDMTGIECELINATFYNGERQQQQVGAAAETGCTWVLPLTLDPGEMCTLTFTMGALADLGATITAYNGVIRLTAVIEQPKTYWGFRGQVLGAAGVVGISAAFTQPQIPIIPGFALCGVGTNVALTSATTIVVNTLYPARAEYLLSHGDDYLIDADCRALRQIMNCRCGAGGRDPLGIAVTDWCGIPHHMLIARCTPVANNDSTQFTYTNCATVTIDDTISKVLYCYVSGAITPDAAITPPATKEVGGGVTLQNPARQLSPSQSIGPAVITAGTSGGTSLFNLRGARTRL